MKKSSSTLYNKILQQKYKKFIVHNGPQTVEGKCNDEIIKLIKSEINIEL